ARIIIMNQHIPITNIECYDVEKGIYKGDVVIDTDEYLSVKFHQVFFSRHYDKDNDYDRILKEHDFPADDNVLGVAFTLIPKQKLLFAFDPPSKLIKTDDGKKIRIAKPTMVPLTPAQIAKKRRGGLQ
ncbi:unnamed protein product, partial [marine sediment metagenome]